MPDLLAQEATQDMHIERCEFPMIHAVHFVIHGLLGAGVSSASKMDSLGKVNIFPRGQNIDTDARLVERCGIFKSSSRGHAKDFPRDQSAALNWTW